MDDFLQFALLVVTYYKKLKVPLLIKKNYDIVTNLSTTLVSIFLIVDQMSILYMKFQKWKSDTIVENNSNREILLEISACGRPFSFVGSSGSLLQTREKFSN